jgi:hypothetical protein
MEEVPEQPEAMKSIIRVSIIKTSQHLQLSQASFVPGYAKQPQLQDINKWENSTTFQLSNQ